MQGRSASRFEQRAADVPLDKRVPTPRVVGEDMVTKKGVFGIVQGHANRHLAIDPKTGALFVGVGSSGNIGVELFQPESKLVAIDPFRAPSELRAFEICHLIWRRRCFRCS